MCPLSLPYKSFVIPRYFTYFISKKSKIKCEFWFRKGMTHSINNQMDKSGKRWPNVTYQLYLCW